MYKTIVGVLALALSVGTLCSCNSYPERTSKSEVIIDSAKTFVAMLAKENYSVAEKEFTEEMKWGPEMDREKLFTSKVRCRLTSHPQI